MPPTANMNVLGVTGLNRILGEIYEEALPDLRGKRGREVLKEMADTDPILAAILFATTMLIRRLEWAAIPFEDTPEDIENATFLEECRDDMSIAWQHFVAEALTMLTYGWAWFEIIYKLREGEDHTDAKRRSKHTDGRIGWRKFDIRSQDTLFEWQFDDDGGVQGMVQQAPPDYKTVIIPIEKSLLFRTTVAKGNPEGRSIFRGAYRPYFFKKHIENIEAIGVERDLAGLPIAYVPPDILLPSASEDEAAALQVVQNIVRGIKRDKNEGIVMPRYYDDKGNLLYELALLSAGGQRQFDTDKVINRHESRMAMTVLADFIFLGHEKSGSWALSSDKTALYGYSIQAFADDIASVINAHAVRRLWALNGLPMDRMATFQPGDVETLPLSEVAQILTAGAQSGALTFPDDKLENWLRSLVGMPAKPEDITPPDTRPQTPPTPPPAPAGDDDPPEDVDDDTADDLAGAVA